MPKSKERQVHVLPSEWNYSFISAWRVFERSLNPAFVFILKCTKCEESGTPTIDFVMSTKNEKAILGLECTNCLNTIKFEGTIDPDADDFPAFLKPRSHSVLTVDGKSVKEVEPSDDYLELMFP